MPLDDSKSIRLVGASLDSIAPFEAGIVWPAELSFGSIADRISDARRAEGNGFLVCQGKIADKLVAAVTLQRTESQYPSSSERLRTMITSLLAAHRPRLVICAIPLRVVGDEEKEQLSSASMQKFAISVAETIVSEKSGNSSTIDDDLRQLCDTLRLPLASWQEDRPERPAGEVAVLVDDAPNVVREECEKRAVASLALGIIRYEAGHAPSAELTDFQRTQSKAKKFGRFLRWAVKNRPAIKEAASAAQDDLVAADKLAKSIEEIVRGLPDSSDDDSPTSE